MMGVPFKGSLGLGPIVPGGGKNGGAASGHGPSAGFDGIWLAAEGFGFTKLAKSTRQLMPGRTMRIGVNPGHRTLSRTKLVSTPKLTAWEPLTQAMESENCTRDSPIKSKTPKLCPNKSELGMSRLGWPVTPGKSYRRRAYCTRPVLTRLDLKTVLRVPTRD